MNLETNKITINGREYIWKVEHGSHNEDWYVRTCFMLKGPIKTSKQFIWWGKEIQEQTYITCFIIYRHIGLGFDEKSLKEQEENYYKTTEQLKKLAEGTLSI